VENPIALGGVSHNLDDRCQSSSLGGMLDGMQRDAELLVSCAVVDLVRHASALCCR
jgi:hypothetical protein